MIVRDALDNGIRLVTESMGHVRSVSLGVWLTRGSRHETDEESGIAHFVEHMLFKGTATRTAEDIAQAVDSIGGQLDAFTAKEYASYYVKVLDEHLPLAVDILSDIVLRPAFHEVDIEREKKVILEEIKMVEDTPDDLVHELFTQAFWEGHPLGRPILGTKESVEALTQQRLREPFPRRLRGRERHHFRGRQPRARAAARGAREGVRRDAVVRDGEQNGGPPHVVPKVVIRKKELEQSHLCLGASSYPQNHDARYASYVLNTMLGGSMSSRLFQNIREKRGLAYSVFSGINAYRDAGYLTVYAGCANEAVGEVIDLVVEEMKLHQAGAGARQRAAAREGSSEGQRHAEPREHGQPHVAPGAAGDLLRPAVQPRRNARRHRAGDAGRHSARGRTSCFPTDRWRRRCSDRSTD